MRKLSLVLVTGVALFGCDSSRYDLVDPVTGVPILPVPDSASIGTAQSSLLVSPELKSVKGCDDLAKLIKMQAMADMHARVQSNFASAWNRHERCDDDPWQWGSPDAGISLPSADGGAVMPTPDPEEDPEHSETNNQVEGVDEADFVKTDGKYIYILGASTFRILKAWPAAETKKLAEITIEGTPKKLFVYNDRVLVYSSLGGYKGGYGGGDCTYGYDCVPTGDGHPTKITVLDITDRAAPQLLRELEISSSLLSARRIGNAVHTVLTTPASPFTGIKYRPEYFDVCKVDPYEIYKAYRNVLYQNIALIEGTPVTKLLPVASDTLHVDGKTVANASPLTGCSSFFRASINDGRQFSTVLSLEIDSSAPSSAVTIFSKPGVVYASLESLYMAVPRPRGELGWFEELRHEQEATAIHKFELGSQPASARYVASGLAKGRILNQFALDEHAGHLRVASTTGRSSWGSAVHNTLTVLKQSDKRLRPVGLLDKLAPTEDIRSVRFDGERGYVVTFKKTDPLFVLDLKQPDKPKVLGELKIPGFSTYMHRMDADHLLTIGYDGDDQGGFAWFTSIMLQIFDVTDPTNPKLKFKHVIGTRGSSSEAATNHLAFTYYAPKDLLAIPMTICEDSAGGGSYGMNMTFSGLMVFDVTAAVGFGERGRVEHPASEGADCSNWWTQSSSKVKRSIIIGNYVYSIADDLLKVSDLDALGQDVAAVPLS